MAAFPRHVCSAFCRDGRHAEVIYCDQLAALPAEQLRMMP